VQTYLGLGGGLGGLGGLGGGLPPGGGLGLRRRPPGGGLLATSGTGGGGLRGGDGLGGGGLGGGDGLGGSGLGGGDGLGGSGLGGDGRGGGGRGGGERGGDAPDGGGALKDGTLRTLVLQSVPYHCILHWQVPLKQEPYVGSQLEQPRVLHSSVLLGHLMVPETKSLGRAVGRLTVWPLGQVTRAVLPATPHRPRMVGDAHAVHAVPCMGTFSAVCAEAGVALRAWSGTATQAGLCYEGM
jgi:hypothetical protein